jgi:hypothetical protein
VFGPSAKEVRFNYTAEFTTKDADKDPIDLAYAHSIHLYGILSTPEMTKKYGVNPKRVGGMGVPRSDIDLTIRKVETNSDGSIRIRYSASGKMLLHLAAVEKVLKDGSITVPMPDDLEAIYDEKCTDEHYNSLGDYWYFWNPFRKGCKYLSDEPYTTPVEIKFNPATEPNLDVMARLDLLRGDNRNGREFLIYTFHGFGDSPSKNDDGRLNYESFHEFLRSEGFEERIESKSFTRPRHEFTKTLTLADGTEIDVRIRSERNDQDFRVGLRSRLHDLITEQLRQQTGQPDRHTDSWEISLRE